LDDKNPGAARLFHLLEKSTVVRGGLSVAGTFPIREAFRRALQPLCTEDLCPGVVVMKSTKDRA
jgi:hypothetical protein